MLEKAWTIEVVGADQKQMHRSPAWSEVCHPKFQSEIRDLNF
jgi:hypothetical protein